jgi:hypothetical protein
MKPTPEFLAASRRVLGDDTPRTVLSAIMENDPRMAEVYALAARDPNAVVLLRYRRSRSAPPVG